MCPGPVRVSLCLVSECFRGVLEILYVYVLIDIVHAHGVCVRAIGAVLASCAVTV